MRTFEEELAHFGVKGMKWGVRRKSGGGDSGPPSEDAAKAIAALTKAKTSGTKSLSNEEMQSIITRMNLEQQYSRLNPQKNPAKAGQLMAKEILSVGNTVNQVISFVNSPAGKAIKAGMAVSASAAAVNKARGGGF